MVELVLNALHGRRIELVADLILATGKREVRVLGVLDGEPILRLDLRANENRRGI